MSRGLAIIYDPHNLYQFVWYYCSGDCDREKRWDALCLPNGGKGEYMHEYCEQADIFDTIYRDDTDFSQLETIKKLRIFASMLVNFLLGRRKAYCHKLLNQFVDFDVYDEVVVIADVGIVSGACVALGREKKVIILEDGINDYSDRKMFIPKNKIKSIYAWQGFFLSFMGYCSPGWFRLKTDKFCIKYASQPQKMKYREYKEIRQLYESNNTDNKLFERIVENMYPTMKKYDFGNIDSVIMTRPLSDVVTDTEKYELRLEDYVKNNFKSILVKTHPREVKNYDFGDNVKTIVVDNSLPAEVILPQIRGKQIMIVTTSSILLYFKAYNLDCKIIAFEGMYEESLKDNANGKAPSELEIKEFADRFCEGAYELLYL